MKHPNTSLYYLRFLFRESTLAAQIVKARPLQTYKQVNSNKNVQIRNRKKPSAWQKRTPLIFSFHVWFSHSDKKKRRDNLFAHLLIPNDSALKRKMHLGDFRNSAYCSKTLEGDGEQPCHETPTHFLFFDFQGTDTSSSDRQNLTITNNKTHIFTNKQKQN